MTVVTEGAPSRARTVRVSLALALVAIAAALGLAPSRAEAAVPPDFWGVVPQGSLSAQDYARMGEGKVGTVRLPMFWSHLDQGPGIGTDWSSFDGQVGEAAINGVRVFPFVYGTPAWVAQQLDGRNCKPEKCTILAPSKPAALDAWAEFLKTAVARYGPDGTYWAENPSIPKVPITDWQLWNEQNSKTFYAPKASPKAYAKLIAAGASAVRGQDAGAEVVLGGMAELAGSKKAIEASKYLQDLYRVKGAANSFDSVAVHPYGASVRKVSDQIELFRKVMKKGGDKEGGLWVTEVGWSSKKGGNPLNVGKDGQAARLKQAFKYFEKKRGKHNLQGITWYSWMDTKASICDWCAKSGLFEEGLDPKPAWKAFTKFTGGS